MTKDARYTLNYDAPACCFNEALPIGNGRLGAMVYGGGGRERISLNDDTLWAGSTPPAPRPEAAQALPKIRELLFGGARHDAEKLVAQTFQTEFTQPYLPAGDLLIDWPKDMDLSAYQRDLALNHAVASVSHGTEKTRVERQYFATASDQVIALHIASAQPLSKVRLRLRSPLKSQITVQGHRIVLEGRAPSAVLWDDVEMSTTETYQAHYHETSRPFAIVLDIQTTSGLITAKDDEIIVTDARDLTLRIAIATDAHGDDTVAHCQHCLDRAATEFSALKQRHIADYRTYFDKISLDLGPHKTRDAQMTIPQRLAAFEAGKCDPRFLTLLFHYARYLMISASRAGTMPANLQGIWNEDIMPAWWSNYTININTQMNYWMAETCGLGESHSALCDFVETLSRKGQETARVHFGCDGWVANHQTDYRRQTTPVGFARRAPMANSAKWSMWPMGGAWLSLHLYQHYQYGGDLGRLREQDFPVMKGAATFLLDWLIEDPRNPEFVTTAPSTSPENTYIAEDGHPCALSLGTTMDISISRALFAAVLDASDQLETPDQDFVDRVRAMQKRLPEIALTDDGRIREFDADWPEAEHPHRHISHLFSLCPGNEICPDETPDLAQAAAKSLLARGPEGTGWSLVWKALCWARLGNANNAYDLLQRLLTPIDPQVTHMADTGGGIYPNLLTACPPFQIEANFGFGATILEMLLQDHRSALRLLPALPPQWPEGQAKGVHLRGGQRLDLMWEDGCLTHAQVHSPVDLEREVIYGDKRCKVQFKAGTHTDLMPFFAAKHIGAA